MIEDPAGYVKRAAVNPFADQVERAAEQLRDHVGGDGVGAENEGSPCPFTAPVVDFDGIEEQCEESQGDSGGDEHVGAGPELLVEREPDRPQSSDGEAGGCSTGQAGSFAAQGVLAA